MKPRSLIAAAILLVCWAAPSSSEAFYILSPRTEACHERMTLASVGAADESFEAPASSSEAILELFSHRAKAEGVPGNEATEAFVDETAERFGFDDRPRAEQFVLASFVAGVRHPDTDGLSVVKFNETRSVHLQDVNQPLHALRRTGDDYEEGDADAIAAARSVVEQRVQSAARSWRSPAELYLEERWTFAFYGELDVSVFGPAYELGRAAHVIQDAFAHTLRDDQMRITAVGNFVDAIEQRYYEPRDGPAHSDRLDECDGDNSAFDQMRVAAAREASAALLAAAFKILRNDDAANDDATNKRLDVVLDSVFGLRTRCTYQNDYCGSEWKPIADSDLTEPYELTFCTMGTRVNRPGASAPLIAMAVASAMILCRRLRSRSRRSTA